MCGVCFCVCVCVRERERERQRETLYVLTPLFVHYFLCTSIHVFLKLIKGRFLSKSCPLVTLEYSLNYSYMHD